LVFEGLPGSKQRMPVRTSIFINKVKWMSHTALASKDSQFSTITSFHVTSYISYEKMAKPIVYGATEH
jgi:hypothetical protein